jgi:hypothetical protein
MDALGWIQFIVLLSVIGVFRIGERDAIECICKLVQVVVILQQVSADLLRKKLNILLMDLHVFKVNRSRRLLLDPLDGGPRHFIPLHLQRSAGSRIHGALGQRQLGGELGSIFLGGLAILLPRVGATPPRSSLACAFSLRLTG